MLMAHIAGPMPRAISCIVGGVGLGTEGKEELAALEPACIGGTMERGVAGSFDFVDVFAVFNGFADSCRGGCLVGGVRDGNWLVRGRIRGSIIMLWCKFD
jgi:hypothetical protein